MEDKKNLEVDENKKVENRDDFVENLLDIIRSHKDAKEKIELINDYHENDLADVLEELSKDERIKLYNLIGLEKTSEVFSYIDEPGMYIEELDSEFAADILETMDSDDAVDILEELEDDKEVELKKLMDEDAIEDINLIQSYSDDQIGSKMTTNYVTIQLGMTVREAMKTLVKKAADNDNIMTLYVLKDDKFYGTIDLTDLIVAREYVDLESLVTTSYPFVYATEAVDDCIEELKDYSEDSIPVLDEDRHILGVITSADLLEVVDEEMGEDYAKLAGLSGEEDLKEPLSQSLKKRIPWLAILMILELAVISVTGMFESVIDTLPIMVTFASAILGMAGNVGTQTLAVTIRVLMDEELTTADELKFIGKELRVGFFNGLLIGGLSFFVISSYVIFFKAQPFQYAFMMAGCFAIALWAAMIISSIVGALVPIIFTKIGIDPAVASGPLISTMNDIVAVVAYYGLIWILLINVLDLPSKLNI